MFLRGFSKDVNWRTSKREQLDICFKSTFLIQAKAQMQMCPYCPLRRSVNLYGSLFLASHHVGYYFIWEKNETWSFLLFSLGKKADSFH